MKNKVKKLPIMIVLLMILSFNHLSAQDYYWYIESIDNPAPGYLIIDNPNTESYNFSYALADNYGDAPYYDTLSSIDEKIYFLPFYDGSIGCFDGDFLILYNEDMAIIDTVHFPSQYTRDFHDAILLQNGHYMLLCGNYRIVDMSEIVENGYSEAQIMSTILVETDPSGEIYWTWDPWDHMNITDVTDDVNLTMPVIDFNHANSIAEDEDGNIYLSSRNLDEITKIDKETGDIIWRMGGSYCKNNQFTFIDDDIGDDFGFSHQHSIEILDNGNFLLFDNGNMRTDNYSRAVEYEVDQENLTATKVWEFRHTPDLISGAMGNVQRLPNGNTFINWSFGTITEVRPDGTIALDVRLTETPIYQAFKTTAKLDVVMHFINRAGFYTFDSEDDHTYIELNINDFTGEGNLSVEKHDYSPPNIVYADSSVSGVLPYRWVARKDSLGDISGTLYLSLYDIIGELDPQKVSIYHREAETTGIFEQMATNYDSNNNRIFADFSETGEFIVCSHILGSPSLISPENEAQSIPSDTEFSWDRITGAEEYLFQLSDNVGFANIVEELIADDTFCIVNDMDKSQQYFWRVYAINSKDSSEWSETYSFSTRLAEPQLLYPENNSTSIDLNDTVKWGSVEEATGYQLQVSKNEDFVNNMINSNTIDTSYTLNNLEHSGIYLWRVRAYNNRDTSDWSTVRSFETEKIAPTLLSPNNQESDVSLGGFLTWLAVPLAVSYSFEIAKDPLFENVVLSDTSITDNYYFYDDLEYSTQYYWRVKAVFRSDTSGWSSTWSFTTVEESIVKVPDLISPENGSLENENSGTLIWTKIEDASYYELNVSKTKSFDSLVVEEFFLIDTVFAYTEFEADSTYYWRVKAFSSVDSSNWSSIWSFKIKEEIKLGFVHLVHPFYNSIQIPIESEFRWRSEENAVKYQLQITDFYFHEDSLLVNDFTSDTVYLFSGLEKNEKYFWRVRYFTEADTSMWTFPWIFTTEPVVLLDTPELIFPKDSARIVPVDIEFKWQKIEGEEIYMLECSRYPYFFPWKYFFYDIEEDFLEYSQLLYNTKYYWRLMAYNDSSYSQWSNVGVFFTELQPPIVIYPDSTVSEVNVNGNIVWDTVKGADRYIIEFAKDELFDDVIINEEIRNKLSYSYSLESDNEYFYRVKALNDSNESQWTYGMMITEKTSNIDDMNSTYQNVIIYPNPAKNELITEINNIGSQTVNIRIINLLGDVVFQASHQNTKGGDILERIDISTINNGIYHFVCEFDTGVIVKKLIVIK